MHADTSAVPGHYRSTVRTLLKFAIVATVVAFLAGVAFQESQKKLSYADAAPGLRLEAILSLALVHGHIFVTAVLIPIAMACVLFLARKIGGAELTRSSLAYLTRGYLPAVTVTLLLMLYKGYHVLLAVRHGTTDLAAVDASYFGGSLALRHGVYAVTHITMSVALIVFLVRVWISLRAVPASK
jgi:hypothetical protein